MFELLIMARAQQELDQAHDWWAKHLSASEANRWYNGLIDAMLRLEADPKQYALTAESGLFP